MARSRATEVATMTLIFASVLLTRTTRAQPSREAEAELLFTQGRAEMAKQNYSVACTKLRGSYELAPRPTTLINLGACLEADRRLVSAWYAFTEAGKSTDADAATAVAARDRAARLEPRLSRLTIVVGNEARVPHLQITRDGEPVVEGQWNSEVYVDGGEYVIVARAESTDAWTARISVASELANERVVIPTLRLLEPDPPDPGVAIDKPPETGPAGSSAPQAPGPASTIDAPRQHGLTTMRKAAIGGGILGLAVVGAGLYFGLDARSKEEDADALCPGTTCTGDNAQEALRLNDEAQTAAGRANVLYIGGGVVMVASIGLWFLGAPSASSSGVSVAPIATKTTSGFVVRWRF